MGIFLWLRSSAKAAVLGGVADAFDELRASNPQYVVATPAIEGPQVDETPTPRGRKKGGE